MPAMQGTIASRCFRASELFFPKAESLILNYVPSRSVHLQSPNCTSSLRIGRINRYGVFTRQLSTRRNLWESSRTACPFSLGQVNAFLSDFPPKNPQDPVILSLSLSLAVCSTWLRVLLYVNVLCMYTLFEIPKC